MKATLLDSIRELFQTFGVGVISGGIGGALMHLHTFTKGESFKISVFLISTAIGGFVGYIIGEFSNSGAMAGVGGAISMKIFDLASENGLVLLEGYIKSKYQIKKEDEKN